MLQNTILKLMKIRLNPKDEICLLKIEQLIWILENPNLKVFEILPRFLHVIMIFIDFKIMFCNTGAHSVFSLISTVGKYIARISS